MAKPTSGQMKEFWTLVDSGHINTQNFQAFLRDPNQGDSGIIKHNLTYTPNIVNQLGDEGDYRGCRNRNINDDSYPTKGKDCVVRYRLIAGEELKRADGWVYRSDIEAYFRDRGMRFPNAAEALLPPAKDKELGRGAHPMVAFIGGSRAAFIVEEDNHGRGLGQYIDNDIWHPGYVFLAVCE